MSIAARPLWQQVTALVSLSTGGAITNPAKSNPGETVHPASVHAPSVRAACQ